MYPSGRGWSWAVSSSRAHAVQTLQARKVGKGARQPRCTAVAWLYPRQAADCRLQRRPPLLVSSLRTEADSGVGAVVSTEQAFKRGEVLLAFWNLCMCIHVCTCTYICRHPHTFSFTVLSHTLSL